MSRLLDTDPNHRDAFEHEHQLEPGWTSGDVEFDDEPPSTELDTGPGQRKWMLLGVGVCGLITAALVLSLNAGDSPGTTAKRLELPPPAFRVTTTPAAPAASAPELPETETTTLAATLAAAVEAPDPPRFHAPPPPPVLADQPRAQTSPPPEAPPPEAPPPSASGVVEPRAAEPSPVVDAEPEPVVLEPDAATPSLVVKPTLGELPSVEDEDEDEDELLLPVDELGGDSVAPAAPADQLVHGEASALVDVSLDEVPSVFER